MAQYTTKFPRANNGQTKAKLMASAKALHQKSLAQQNAKTAKLNSSPTISGALTPYSNEFVNSVIQNPKVASFTEIFNPRTNKYEKIITGLAAVHSMLPPDKQINMVNMRNAGEKIKAAGENAFKGVKAPSKSEEMTVMNSSYGLSKAPTPRSVNLNSGVAPTCWANDYMTPIEGQCSPMHMSAAKLGLPLLPGNLMYDYLINTIAFDIQTRAQANINFTLDLVTGFSAASIISAFNDVIRALQIYYYYSSILSYESDTRNKNAAMINLRQGITSQMISDLVSLERRLEDTPCPPRIVQWVRYMSMNYLSGNSQGAPLLKIAPTYNFEASTTAIATALTAISTPTINNTLVLMRRAIPQWRIGRLYDVPVIPVYDTNFLSIFANLQSGQNNSAAQLLTSPPGNVLYTDPIMYNSFNNRLDGAAYAMSSATIAAGNFIPGLCIPDWIATVSSRRSFYSVSGVLGWYAAGQYPFLSVSRPETYKMLAYTDTVNTKLHLPGAEMCQGVTANSLLQSGKNFVDFLFNANSVASVGKLSAFNRRA